MWIKLNAFALPGDRLRTTLFFRRLALQKSGGETCTPRRVGCRFRQGLRRVEKAAAGSG